MAQIEGGGSVSRRGFLKGGIAALGTAAFASGIGFLPACTPQEDVTAAGAENAAAQQGLKFEVYDADLLVIGGGNSATQAANQAYDMGAKVIVVDKGPFGYGGAGGMNFDIGLWNISAMREQDPGLEPGGVYSMANQKLRERSNEYTEFDMVEYFRNNGAISTERLPDGSVIMAIGDTEGFGMNSQGGFMRVFADKLTYRGVLVYDQTMITGIVAKDGVLQGVVGLHIPSGTYRVFRCKAAVVATGPSTAFAGWVSVAPRNTSGAGDNTGDVDAAAYRLGETLIGSEFFSWDTCVAYPEGIAFGFNLAFTCDPEVDAGGMMDVNGEHFAEGANERPVFFQACAKALADGRANERDAFYYQITEQNVMMMRFTYRRNIQFWKEKFGIDVMADPVELALNCFEHSGNPRVDENCMFPGIAGMFSMRSPDANGEAGGLSALAAVRISRYASACAVDYLKGAPAADEIDWEQVAAEIERLEEIRTHTDGNPLRPHEVRHAIQKAAGDGMRPGGNAEQYAAGVAELERIIAEDLPRQTVTNQTLVFNKEWKEGIENYNLAIVALATIKSMEMREESRAGFMRTDFPEPDDAFWGRNFVGCRMADDGSMVAEAVPCAE